MVGGLTRETIDMLIHGARQVSSALWHGMHGLAGMGGRLVGAMGAIDKSLPFGPVGAHAQATEGVRCEAGLEQGVGQSEMDRADRAG
jgi:hypothetical protein